MPLRPYIDKNIITAVLMTFVIFAVDLFSPFWYEAWPLYLIPLFFMYRSAKRPYVFSVIITLLVASPLFLFPMDSGLLMQSAANLITGIFGGWLLHQAGMPTIKVRRTIGPWDFRHA